MAKVQPDWWELKGEDSNDQNQEWKRRYYDWNYGNQKVYDITQWTLCQLMYQFRWNGINS